MLLWGIRVIAPRKLQTQLLDELHRDHPGISRMKAVARSYFWWPCSDKAIENVVKSVSGSEALTCRSAVAAMGVASSALEASSPGFCRPFPRSYVSSSR